MLPAKDGAGQVSPLEESPSIRKELLTPEDAPFFLAAIVESSRDSIVTINFEGIITSWNKAAQDVYGYSAHEAIGKPLTMLTLPGDLELVLRNIENVKHGRRVEIFDSVRLNKDGRYMDLEVMMSPVKDTEGQVIGISTIARDITFKKAAEEALRQSEEQHRREERRQSEALRQSEERLRLLIESAKDYAIFTQDNERRVNSWNTGAQAIFGYTEDEILGRSGDILFVPEDREKRAPEAEALKARTQGRAQDERWHLRQDGSRFYGSGVNMPLREEDGTIIGCVKIMRDLTPQKQVEDALRASEEHLRLAVEAGHLATCDWNYQTGEMIGNVQRYLLMGLDPEQGVITVSQFQYCLHPEDRERTWTALIEQIETRGQHAEEYRVVLPGGEVRWIAEAGRVVEWHHDQPQRIASVLWDVTQRHEVQEELRHSHEQLEALVEERTHELKQALSERTQLVRRIVNTQEEERGRISRELHDNLGQHLTAVMLGLQALEMQIGTITGGKRQSGTPQLDNLRSLVDGLMKAAHRQAWELRPAELDALGLEAALGQYTRDWSTRTDVEVDFQAVGWEERPAPEVETTLYRVAQEALTNVARHANATFVSVVLEQSEGVASIIVEDNGHGFDPEQTQGRLGVLGMKERLALVGGTLDIESIPSDGTTVFARIPLSQS